MTSFPGVSRSASLAWLVMAFASRLPAAPPAWTAAFAAPPDAAVIERLAGEVAAKPRDRVARNRHAYALRQAGRYQELSAAARSWLPFDPRNPQVYEYLGDGLAATGDPRKALRAWSSMADLAPNDSGLLNRAGYLAVRAGQPAMAVPLFEAAIERRPDHQNNYRGLALAHWLGGDHRAALTALERGLAQDFDARYHDVKRVLREEAALVVRAWTQAGTGDGDEIARTAARLALDLEARPELRITLEWETDANDVDLHVVDPAGEECFYSHTRNASGLHLYADLTQGLGPEVMVVPAGQRLPGPYRIGVKYFAAGPMGASRGVVVVHGPPVGGRPAVRIETFVLLPPEGTADADQDMRAILEIGESGP